MAASLLRGRGHKTVVVQLQPQVRTVVLVATVLGVVATAGAVAGSIAEGWTLGLPRSSDRAVQVTNVIGLAAFILVAITALVALVAYRAASGRPDLVPQISFRFSDVNRPVFAASEVSGGASQRKRVVDYRQVEGSVAILNRSKYAGRNAGFRIRLDGLGGLQSQDRWTTVERVNQIGPAVIQWDAGVDYLIHGDWERSLPGLNFAGLVAYSKTPALVVTLAADGMTPQHWRFPVTLLLADEYDRYSAERSRRFEGESQRAKRHRR